MKILIATDSYKFNTGGITASVLALCSGLRKKGHEVKVLSPSSSHKSFRDGDDYFIKSVPAFYYQGMRIAFSLHDPLIKELEAWCPDVIHVQTEGAAFLISKIIMKCCDAPIVMTCHTDYAHFVFGRLRSFPLIKAFMRGVGKTLYRKAAKVIAPSQKAGNFAFLQSIKERMAVIPNGIELEKYQKTLSLPEKQALRKSLGIDDRTKVIVSISRLSKEKNIRELIAFFPLLLKKMRDVFNIRKTLYTLTHKAGNKVKLEFFTMLNFMLESGLALYESLIGIRDSGNNKQLKNLTKRLADEVRKGAGLSLAMKKSGQFDDATVQQLKAGEESGQINETLKRMIFQLDHELEFKSKIKSAMIYPVIICVVMIVVLWVMMTMVVPTLAETLVSMGGELPLITKIVIASSNIMKMSTPFVIILIVIAIIGYKAGRRNDEFKYATDRLKLSIPIIGNMIEKIELSKFCRNLSAMQKSGITLVSSLKTVETAVKNSKIAKEIDKACRLVEISGMNLSVALSKTGNFPPLMLQLIEIGISSGQICDVLDRIALQYEKETNESLKRLTGLLEPSMIVISGCAVGLIVVSLMLPMFSMTDVIGV